MGAIGVGVGVGFARRAWVWAAVCVKTEEQQVTPSLQESASMSCLMDNWRFGSNLWTHWPVVGAWLAMHTWASTSQFLLHNSAASQYLVVVDMQMDAHLKKEQIGTLLVRQGQCLGPLGGEGGGRGICPRIYTWRPSDFLPSWTMDVFCRAGSDQQAQQSTHLAEGLNLL